MTNNDVAQLPRLPYVCDACGVQQHADGICANCGGRVRSRPSLVADNPTTPPADVAGAPQVAFTAYNQAIEDAKATIRGERVDDPYAAATFINAIARKCSPHRYAQNVDSNADLAYADGYTDGFRHGMQSRQPIQSEVKAPPQEPSLPDLAIEAAIYLDRLEVRQASQIAYALRECVKANTRATPADLTERSQAFYSVIVGIAKSLGWSNAWPDPKDDSRWFVERPSREEGKIEMAPLEAAIALRSANLTERARRLADQIIARIGEADLRPLVSDTLYMIDAATTTQRQVIRNRLAAIIVAEFTDASGTSAEMKSHDLNTHSEPENQ